MYQSPAKSKRVKAISIITLLIISFFLFSKCEDAKDHPRAYPLLRSPKVSNINEQGASFSADIYSLGSETIIEHGFVWAIPNQWEPTLQSSNKILLGTCTKTGVYTANIVSTLANGREYTMKPFVQTAEHIVYGTSVKFTSLGSGAPEIHSFEPHTGAWRDTIIIKGRNFSWNPSENTVNLNQTRCMAFQSTDTTISITVPTDLNDLESALSVKLADRTTVYDDVSFRLLPPVFTGFYPKEGRWNDTLYIKGSRLLLFRYYSGNNIKLGSVACQLGGVYSDTLISVIVHNDIVTTSNTVTMFFNGFILSAEEPFNLLPPFFDFSPAEGTWGTIVKLKGRFNAYKPRNTVRFGNINADIISCTAKELTVTVPNTLSETESDIINIAGPFTVTSASKFRLRVPETKNSSPAQGPAVTDPSGK
jgi:hypothetical protein